MRSRSREMRKARSPTTDANPKILASVVLLALMIASAIQGGPARAGTEDAPEVTDIAGDANGVSFSAAPASIDEADILAVWESTIWRKARKKRKGKKKPKITKHIPKGLRVSIKTVAPASSGGWDLQYGLSWRAESMNECEGPGDVSLSISPASNPAVAGLDLSSCGGNAPTEPVSLPVSSKGEVVSVEIDFKKTGDVFAPGDALQSPGASAWARQGASSSFIPNWVLLDETGPLEAFTIGSDKPGAPSSTVKEVEREVVLEYEVATGLLVGNGTYMVTCQAPIGGCFRVAAQPREQYVSVEATTSGGRPAPFRLDVNDGSFGRCGSTGGAVALGEDDEIAITVKALGAPPSGQLCESLGSGGTVTVTFSNIKSG